MAHLTRPAVIAGVSAGSFPETAAGNRAYILLDFRKYDLFQILGSKVFCLEGLQLTNFRLTGS